MAALPKFHYKARLTLLQREQIGEYMSISTRLKQCLFGLACMVLVTCSGQGLVQTKTADVKPDTPFALTLTNLKSGLWRLDIELFEPQNALMFSRSTHDYRIKSYKALSSGARLERIGGFDTILFDPGVMNAGFEFTPFTGTLPGTYTPFIPFSDGGQAIYLGAFELLRIENAGAVEALQGKLDAWTGEQFDIPVHLKTDGSILLDGQIILGTAETSINGNGSYAYIGPTALVEGNSFSGVLDPNLPNWLVEDFDKDLGQIFWALEDGFNRGLTDKATIMFAFRGYETEGFSNTGGVLPGGLMVLETSGNAMREPNERLRGYLHWFLTHEATHLFQHPDGVTYADKSDSWILEGGANAMTHVILERLKTVPNDVIQGRYRDGFEYCVDAIQNSSMAEITIKNNQSHYDCGDFVFRISDAALPQHNIFEIWAALLAHTNEDKSYNTATYFTALLKLGADDTLVERLESFVEGPVQDPAKALREMMKAVGIQASFKDDALTAIRFP